MRTTFSGISIALRALQAQQVSLDVTGHNVANVNTPGYSRQSAIHSATKAYPVPTLGHNVSNGQLGTGVEISQIVRIRDQFVDGRLRQENHNFGYWGTLYDGLAQVELFFNEPGETGISNALDHLWDSLQDLSQNADQDSVREVVIQRAEVLVESIRNTGTQLQALRGDLNDSVEVQVSEINSLAAQIADLNNQISKVTATGSSPNDLLDQRDMLLNQLSKIVDIDVTNDHANMVGVTLGGVSLVHRGTSYSLGITKTARHGYEPLEVHWAATGEKADIRGGELGGTFRLRDVEVQNYMDKLDQWTREFVTAFNDIHTDEHGFDLHGQTGQDFFVFLSEDADNGDKEFFAALDIAVNSSIVEDPRKIAAGYIEGYSPGDDWQEQIGNGENALRLGALRSTPPSGSEFTIGDSFVSIISDLGVTTQKAQRMKDNEEVLINHLANLQESVAGVSLDEEMANMIKFQHAYNAAARLMTTVDESLDVIINRLGLIGR